MRIFGFKPMRFRQWLEVLEEEQRSLSWRDKLAMLWHIVAAGTQLGTVTRKEWRAKMRKCPSFVPFLALTEKQCFADTNDESKNFGWNSKGH